MTTDCDIERAASGWLAQIGRGELTRGWRAEFDLWLADSRHELAVARLIVSALDTELRADAVRRCGRIWPAF